MYAAAKRKILPDNSAQESADLRRLIDLDTPALRVTYKLQEMGEPTLKDVLAEKGLLETALV